MIEIEVKAHVENPELVEKAIVSMGALPVGIDNQADTYYNSQYRDFGNTDEALRIRSQDGVYFLTYKGPRMDSVSKTREEFEVEIKDTTLMGKILSSLGYYPVATVVKKRKKFIMGDFFLALDDVRDLGSFIEIEITAKNPDNYEEKLNRIFQFIEKLGISRKATVRESYLEMFLSKSSAAHRSSAVE